FFRTVGSVFGVAICGTIFNNILSNNLGPLEALDPQVAMVVRDSSAINRIDEPLRSQVIHQYMESLLTIYQVCIPFLGVAFLISLFIRHHALKKTLGPTITE